MMPQGDLSPVAKLRGTNDCLSVQSVVLVKANLPTCETVESLVTVTSCKAQGNYISGDGRWDA